MSAKIITDGLAKIVPENNLQFIILTYLGETAVLWLGLSLSKSNFKAKYFQNAVKKYFQDISNATCYDFRDQIRNKHKYAKGKWGARISTKIKERENQLPGGKINKWFDGKINKWSGGKIDEWFDSKINKWFGSNIGEIVEEMIVNFNDVDTLVWYISDVGKGHIWRLWQNAMLNNKIKICRCLFKHRAPQSTIVRDNYLNRALECFGNSRNFNAIKWCIDNGARDVWRLYCLMTNQDPRSGHILDIGGLGEFLIGNELFEFYCCWIEEWGVDRAKEYYKNGSYADAKFEVVVSNAHNPPAIKCLSKGTRNTRSLLWKFNGNDNSSVSPDVEYFSGFIVICFFIIGLIMAVYNLTLCDSLTFCFRS